MVKGTCDNSEIFRHISLVSHTKAFNTENSIAYLSIKNQTRWERWGRKRNLHTMNRQNTKLQSAMLCVSELRCSLYAVQVLSPQNQFKYYLESQPRQLWVLQHWNCTRDKLSILETGLAFVSFSIPGITSESLCNLSHLDPDLANACLQRSSHTQSFKGRRWRNQGLKSCGCQFPICTIMEFFPPCRTLCSVCIPLTTST